MSIWALVKRKGNEKMETKMPRQQDNSVGHRRQLPGQVDH